MWPKNTTGPLAATMYVCVNFGLLWASLVVLVELGFFLLGFDVFKQDELLWAAAWLYQATNNQYYLNYLAKNGDSMGGTGWGMTEFGWDVKYAGVQTLVAKVMY